MDPKFFKDVCDAGGLLVAANKKHAREIGRIMRSKDADEARAAGGFAPAAAARMSINNSTEAYAVYAPGSHLLAVFGVGPMHGAPNVHVAWALTSVYAEQHQLTFWRCSKVVASYLRDRYEVMVNMIHSKNPGAMAWARRLGFKVSLDFEHFGTRGDLFARAVCHSPKVILTEARHV